MTRVRAVIAAAAIILGLVACQVAGPTSPAASPGLPVPAAAAPEPAGNPPGPWRLRLNDEFNGRSLNRSVWSTGWLAPGITPPVNSGELECYDPRNVRVQDGTLQLSLIGRPTAGGGKPRPYVSGMINSDGKFQFTYGLLEARLWLPGQGRVLTDWPAFWADGQNWPADGEIDVVEGLGGEACWHFDYPGRAPGGCHPGNYANGWHTFGADWEPGSITYYYDGHVVGTLRSGITSAPMYLILNLATANAYGIPVRVPATMRVCYVRVWQHPG